MHRITSLVRALVPRPQRPWQRNGTRLLFILLAVLVTGLVAGGAYGRLEALRRTQSAVVTIESMAFQPGRGPYPHTPQGHHLRYSYVVRGSRYEGAAFRRWTDVDRYRPKVCYDPMQPADHVLVTGWHRCGTWPLDVDR